MDSYINDQMNGLDVDQIFENIKARMNKAVKDAPVHGPALVEADDLRVMMTYVDNMEWFIDTFSSEGKQ